MTTVTRPNLSTRQNHNLYSVPDPLGAGKTEADQVGFLDIEKARNEAYRLDQVSTLVAGYDNNRMDAGITDDWAIGASGVEGGPQLLQLAEEMNKDGYSPSAIKLESNDKFMKYMDVSLKADYQRRTIDNTALLAAHPGKTFEEAAQEELPNVLAALDTKISSLTHKQTVGTITNAEKADLPNAIASRLKVSNLSGQVSRGHVIGSRKPQAANFTKKADLHDKKPKNARYKSDYEKAERYLESESNTLHREAALFHGIAELDGGKYADESFKDKSEPHLKLLHEAKDTPAPVVANTMTNADTDRLRKLAYEDQKAAVQNRYDLAVHKLANVAGGKSRDLRFRSVDTPAADEAHGEFSDAIFQMMQYDDQYKGVLTNPDLTNAERGAMINAYYVSKFNDLRQPTIEARANNTVDKGANFILKHKRALKIGALVLGGLTGGLGGAIMGTAIAVGASKAAKRQATKLAEQNAADTGAAGTLSHLSAYESLGEVSHVTNSMRKDEMPSPQELRLIAQMAAENLRSQYEKTIEKYREEHVKRMLGSAAVGVAWTGAILVGSEMVTGFVDYQMHGSGGLMDMATSHDNPGGAPFWRPTVEKPWWMDVGMGTVATSAATAGALALAYKTAKKKGKIPGATPPTSTP